MDPKQYVAGETVVRSRNLITSQGAGTAIEFAVAVVEALYGKEKAQETAQPLVLKASESFYEEVAPQKHTLVV